jgi:hypothetical protein
MKKILMVIAVMAMGLTVVPQVQAQTAQQQRELEQIAQRSMNGLSAQDRKRVVEIMADVYVKQGMSKQQAASFAEMAADSMFTDYQGQGPTAEQQRQLEEQNRATENYDQGRRQAQQQTQQREPWPPSSAFARFGFNIPKPTGTYTIIWQQDGNEGLTIQFEKQNRQAFTDAEIRDICRIFEPAFGAAFPASSAYSGQMWRDRLLKDDNIQTSIQDPQRRSTASMTCSIMLDVQLDSYYKRHIKFQMSPVSSVNAQ